MKWIFILIGTFIALFPMASFVLIALEVVMVFKIAKSHRVSNLGDIIWFCTIMVTVSFVLKFIAAWLHMLPIIGQVANSLVAAAFIYFAYEVADAHYGKMESGG